MPSSVEYFCNVSKKFSDNQLFMLYEGFSGFCTLPALTMLVYIGFWKIKPVSHANFKIILLNSYIAITINLVSHFAGNFRPFFYHQFRPGDCDIIISTSWCFAMRWPSTWTITTISLLHLCVFIERLMATRFKNAYEYYGRSLGIMMTVFVWTATLILNSIAHNVLEERFSRYHSYCNGITGNNDVGVRTLLQFVLLLDCGVTIGELFLTMANKKSKIYINYTLSRAYQQGENYLTTRLLTPISFTHSCLFTLFLVAIITSRLEFRYNDDPIKYMVAILTSHNIFVLSMSLCLAFYIKQVHWSKKQKRLYDLKIGRHEVGGLYFSQLQEQLTQC